MNVHEFRHEVHHGRVVRAYAKRPRNVNAMLAQAVALAPDRIALVDGEIRVSYAELERLVERCAGRLALLGIAGGDRVAILLGNRAEFLVALLAIARIGAVALPMNIRQKLPETTFALNDSGAVALFHERSLAAEIPSAMEVPALRHRIAVDDDQEVWQFPEVEPADAVPVAEDAPFCILYTSGTTGRPKGALLTHFGVLTSAAGAAQALDLRDGAVTVTAVPLSHVTGIVMNLLLMLHVAGTSVLQSEFKARRFLELAEREGMTFACMVPAMYVLCLRDEEFSCLDLSRWRVGTYGGAPMPDGAIGDLARLLPDLRLSNVYGATETSSPAVIMPPCDAAVRKHQVGRPLPYCDLLVVDDEGCEVGRGEQGEIWMAGPMVIPEYWSNPQASAAAFTGGYWRSGDIGILDADGYLQLCDRKKDMINRGGFKIYSVEVENVLMSHPAVVEAGVVGRPCDVLGERVEAFVFLCAQADGAELRGYCAARLSDYKVPDTVTIVTKPLPRNLNGKLLKTELRERLGRGE